MRTPNRAFPNRQGERWNHRSVGVLRDGQDEAVVLLRRALVLARVMIMVAIMLAAAMPLSLNLADMLESSGKLLKKMMHAMRRGGGAEKPKSDRDAEAQAASEFRNWSLGIHRQHRRYRNRSAAGAQAALPLAGEALFDRELNLILGIQLSLMIGCHHA